MLSISNLSKSFGGVQAVQDVSFHGARRGDPLGHRAERRRQDHPVQPDQRRFMRPAAGSIVVRRGQCAGLSPDALARRGMSRTFQNLQVCMNMSAIDNVMVGAHLRLNQNLFAAHAGAAFAAPARCGLPRGGGRADGLRRRRQIPRCRSEPDAVWRAEAPGDRAGAGGEAEAAAAGRAGGGPEPHRDGRNRSPDPQGRGARASRWCWWSTT